MITCVIDACSYIYLHKSSFNIGGKESSLFNILNTTNNLAIKQSSTVQKEILKHFDKADTPETTIKIQNRNYTFFPDGKKPLSFYDTVLFEGMITKTTDDAGEKANLAVCIDSFNPRNNQSIVFLTDDKKAVKNENMKLIFGAFPYFLQWTSFDVILFLYYTNHKKGFTYDLATSAVQDILSFLTKEGRRIEKNKKDSGEIDNDEYSTRVQKITTKYQKIRADYIEKLNTLKKFLDDD